MSDSIDISNFRRALPQFIAVSIKNILLFVYGMTLGFPTIVIPAIQGGEGREPSDIVLNREEISWFSSINLICVPLGCLFSGIVSQPIGKRRAMQLVNLPILVSWLLFHFSTRTEHLYAALCLSGLGGGLMEAPVLTYVAEITEPKYRGTLSALGSTCVISGVFIQFIMGSLMDWRTISAVSTAFPIISIIALCFIPESPTWLIRKRRYGEAIKALQWLRGWVPVQKIEEEFNHLYNELITQPARELAENKTNTNINSRCIGRLRLFRKRSFLVPFLLVTYTFFAGHFSGKTSLQTYAVQIFHTLKAPINKYHATIILGVAELIATVICVFVIHLTGKRPLVLVSVIGVGCCFFGTATYSQHLKIVPGFAVNNVVVNASSIVPQDSIITQDNITKIFENNEKIIDSSWMVKGYDQNLDHLETNLSSIMKDSSYSELPTPLSSNTNSERPKSNKTTDIQSDSEQSSDQSSSNKVLKNILLPVPKQQKNYLVWIPLILLLGSAFFAHCGIRMIPWILIGEVFPAPIRGTASGLVSGIGYIFGFLANKLFLQMLSTLTLPGTFWFYSAVAFSAAIILYFTLPETEGRTLSEIEAHFSKKSKTNLLKDCKKNKTDNFIGKYTNNKFDIELNNEQNLQKRVVTDTKPKTTREEFGTGHINHAFSEIAI